MSIAIHKSAGLPDLPPLTEEEKGIRDAEAANVQQEFRQCRTNVYKLSSQTRELFLWRETHDSFAAWIMDQARVSKSTAYRMIDMDQVAANIEAILGPDEAPTGNTLITLKAIPDATPARQREVYAKARAETPPDKPVTPKAVRKAAGVEETPQGQSRVNGELVADPPDVAKMRATGQIPEGVIPEVQEKGDDKEAKVVELEPAEDNLPEETWLATLPLYTQLEGACLRKFRTCASYFRLTSKARKTFGHQCVLAKGQAQRLHHGSDNICEYLDRKAFSLAHPKTWLLCKPTEDGGCGGAGGLAGAGDCSECYGRGFWIP